ncbi:heterokaryon incompatibility protein-domain-containing protein [Dactylonectria estremocensis]|uniref:Heterokaryon incompatibility protein-domain-containing protein n=1 Tax=Dactylonectria estremocensis TaxID=1079267 RepID=A0A9P9JC69_9HYPO|nr:heterokaryon incompatibility protein-domain-containing protein [Dactylonectria estremocensis]
MLENWLALSAYISFTLTPPLHGRTVQDTLCQLQKTMMSSGQSHEIPGPLPFSYGRLSAGCIRLLERAGEDADGTLRFNIRVCNINDDDLQFHCLSYTWGNPFANGVYGLDHFNAVNAEYMPENGVSILINGRTLRIQKNLHDALSTVSDTAYVDELNRTIGQGQTYLHFAAGKGLGSIVERRIRRGMRVNLADDRGRTALHYAAENGHVDCVEILCKGGSLRGLKDGMGKTALDLAKDQGHDGVISVLDSLSEGPDPDLVTIVKESGADDLIWADAICINQNDIDEKSAQVSMMDRIYSTATFVLAWLGPEGAEADLGLKTLKTLATHIDKFQESQVVPYSGQDKENYAAAGVPFVSWPEWIALAGVFERQWFKRAWIVQEAILPDVLLMYCGKQKVAWYDLGTVAEALRHNEAKLGTSHSKSFVQENQIAVAVEWNMAEIYKWRTFMSAATGTDADKALQYKQSFTLEELVSCFWTFLATDPRDKVFSLHGIMNVFGAERLESDYRRSVASVYTGAARQIILGAGSLSLLSNCIVSPHRREELPSWVPDFGLPGVNAIPNLFSADKGLEYQPLEADRLDSPVLGLRGFCLGRIGKVANRPASNPGDKFLFDPSWLKLALSLRMTKTDGAKASISNILWRTLCMDMSYGSFFNAKKFGPQAPDEFGNQFKLFMMVMILAGADAQVLRHFGIEKPSSDRRLTVITEPYNPFEQDMAVILDNLDKITAYDGNECCTPSREEVTVLWDSLQYTVARLTRANTDGSPVDLYLPPDVISGKARVVGNGLVETGSQLFKRCLSFATAYNVAYGGRQLFTLGDEYLGAGPLSARVGDETWILPGLSTPAVLRRVENTSEAALENALAEASLDERETARRYHFVGAAYVHGIMHGEAPEGSHGKFSDIELV